MTALLTASTSFSAAFYKWLSTYAGMNGREIKRIKRLEEENRKLKQMYANLPAIGSFYPLHPNITIPEKGNIYSVNEGYYKLFPLGVKDYIKYCQEIEDNRPYTARYIGSLGTDFHRNMIKGGIYVPQ